MKEPGADLNPEQREAVLHRGGPLLILAGAGSGKTRVLVHRMASLLAAPGWAGRIVAVTFTNRAAREMRDRVLSLVAAPPSALFLGTFHALGLRLLRRHGAHIGLPSGFAVVDRADSQRLVGELVEAMGGEAARMPARRALTLLSRARNHLEAPAAGSWLAELARRYRERLDRMAALDFDDLLVRPLELLARVPAVAEAERPQHVLVDEFQDTNPAQAALLEALWPTSGDVCVVGDEDQSIYAFRGAALRNILEFEQRHPGTRVLRLERNYRSTAAILGAASTLVERNRERLGKRLSAELGAGQPVRVVRYDSPESEAAGVATLAERLAGKHGRGEVAVLYRTNAQSRLLEEAFLERNIPYVIVKGLRFYERREVKDVLAYLRLIANPADDTSFERIVNVPARGIGAAALDEVRSRARADDLSLLEASRRIAGEGSALGRRLQGFTTLLSRLRARAGELAPGALIAALLRETGYDKLLEREDQAGGGEKRAENVAELERKAEETGLGPGLDSLQALLDDITLASEPGGGEAGAVSLLTLHNAKGLEFKAVIVCGVEEGLLPHAGLGGEEGEADVEEERRLLYVGMTRAREELVLTAARGRRLWSGGEPTVPSRFLAELGSQHVRQEGDAKAAIPAPGPSAPRSFVPGGAPARPPAPASRPPAPVRPVVETAGPFPVGAWVRHPGYGEGIVLEREGGGDALKVTIRFGSGLKKKFQAKLAGLQELRRKPPAGR